MTPLRRARWKGESLYAAAAHHQDVMQETSSTIPPVKPTIHDRFQVKVEISTIRISPAPPALSRHAASPTSLRRMDPPQRTHSIAMSEYMRRNRKLSLLTRGGSELTTPRRWQNRHRSASRGRLALCRVPLTAGKADRRARLLASRYPRSPGIRGDELVAPKRRKSPPWPTLP